MCDSMVHVVTNYEYNEIICMGYSVIFIAHGHSSYIITSIFGYGLIILEIVIDYKKTNIIVIVSIKKIKCGPTNVIRILDKHISYHRYVGYLIIFFSSNSLNFIKFIYKLSN